MIKKILTILMIAIMINSAFAEEADISHPPVVVLYTNDVHCSIEDNIGYAGVAAYEAAYEKLGYEVLLVDNGDAIQGAPIGTLSKGEYIIDIMNNIGYDVATPGNHEFDFGMEQFNVLRKKAEFPFVSANFCDLKGNPVLNAYTIREAGDYRIAFVGVSTPQTFISAAPTIFQDSEGNYIYSFSQGEEGKKLYAAVQAAVNAARAEGVDYVIVLSHLGIDAVSIPYTASDLIVNTTGIDVVLDGHSHSVIPQEVVLNAAGEKVLLSSSGTKLENLGALVFAEDGSISTRLHSETIFKGEEAQAYIDSVKHLYEEGLNEVVAFTDVELTITDPATGMYIVRTSETNLGDLCADANRAVTDADISIVNAGCIRSNIDAGEITFGEILNVYPYSNSTCLVETSGQEILDALELGARLLPEANPAFLHVSGLSYEIDVSIPTSVVLDDEKSFVEVTGERRVKNVLVDGEPIDPAATYTMATNNYMIKSGGDGFNMFMDNALLLDEVLLDNQTFINYIVDTLGGTVGEEYADPYGQNRIVIHE